MLLGMKVTKALAWWVVAAAVVAACDLQKTGNQLAARKVMVSTLLATPPIEVKATAIAGLDASIPDASFLLDAGFTFDAGVLLADGGLGYTVPAQTAALVFFGTRVGDGLDAAPEGHAGATITVQPAGGAAVTLKDLGGGSYQANSSEDAKLKYEEDKSYTFTAVADGVTYVAELDKSPEMERINAFHPPAGYIDIAKNTPITFTRPDPPTGQTRNLGFVMVFPISRNGQQGQTTYTNVPMNPLGFLKLVVLPDEWKGTVVTIPGSAFPDADKNYMVLFQTAKLGGPKSDNLFSGSAIIAGTADVGVVKTKP